jgi:SRSO17 transposase
VTAKGHSLIDRELYLPLEWTQDAERRQEAGIQESVRFQTKPELAIQMLKRSLQAQLPIAWVVADSVYGGNLDLRTWLEAHGYPYVLAVACDEPVGIVTLEGGRRRVEAREVEALVLQEQDWQRRAMSEGIKGPRLFDWAVVPMLHQWENDGRRWLLIRRSLTDPQEKCYYLVFAAPGTTLQEMVQALGARWHIEEAFEQAKDMGLDHSEVRSFLGCYRHVTLVMLAMAYLAGICVEEHGLLPSVAEPPTTSLTLVVLPLTIPEVRHLLGHLIWPTPRNMPRALAWSRWRRCHQSRASYFHTKRRLKSLKAG